MAAKIASSTLETAPTDDLVVSDVYSAKTSEPVNANKPSSVSAAAVDVGKALQSNVSVKDLISATTVEDGKSSVSKDKAIDLFKNATGGPNSPLAALQGALQDELLDLLGIETDCLKKNPAVARENRIRELEKAIADSKPEETACTIKTKKGSFSLTGIKTIYSTVQAIRRADLHSAQGVAAMLNSISGNSQLAKVLDMESQFAVLGKIMAKASEYGIPEAIDMLLAKMDNDKERRRLLIENLKNFVYQSDLASINKVIDYVGAQGALARVPDFVTLLMTFYHYPQGVSQPTVALRDQLAATLARVDPNWYTYNRQTVNDPTWSAQKRRCNSPGALNDNTIGNLEPFTYASSDALALFLLPTPAQSPFSVVTNVWYEAALISKDYLSRNILELAREDFPFAVLESPKLYK